jgi:hypothetical protein
MAWRKDLIANNCCERLTARDEKLSVLLKEFQQNATQFAIVVEKR